MTAIGLLLCATISFADEGGQLPALKLVAKPVPTDVQVKVLQKQHTVDLAKQSLADLQQQWAQIQEAARQANASYETKKKVLDEAQKALDEEKKKAFDAAGLDQKAYDLNSEVTEFSPKPSPAPATPSPEKK